MAKSTPKHIQARLTRHTGLFTGREEWFLPSESELKKAMRHYYESSGKIDPSGGIRRADRYSYEAVGNQIKEILEK